MKLLWKACVAWLFTHHRQEGQDVAPARRVLRIDDLRIGTGGAYTIDRDAPAFPIRWTNSSTDISQDFVKRDPPFVNEAHRQSYLTYTAIERLPGNPAVTVVNDLINELRAAKASRDNGYSWSDHALVSSLQLKLNIWILEKLNQAPILLPPEPKHPKAPPPLL